MRLSLMLRDSHIFPHKKEVVEELNRYLCLFLLSGALPSNLCRPRRRTLDLLNSDTLPFADYIL